MNQEAIAGLASLVGLALQVAAPGSAVVTYANAVLAALPALAQTGQDMVDFLGKSMGNISRMITEKRDPSDEDWALINNRIADWMAVVREQVAKDAAGG